MRMEVQNITSANRSNTSFGMALRKPGAKQIDRFVEDLGLDKNGVWAQLRKAGLKQLKKENPGGNFFDVNFTVDMGVNTYQVINNKNQRIVSEYTRGQNGLVKTSYDRSGLSKRLGNANGGERKLNDTVKTVGLTLRELVKLVFNPKETLPRPLLTAAKEAKELEASVLAAERTRVLKNQAVYDINKMFDK